MDIVGIDLLFLAVGIASLIGLQMLRAALSMQFPTVSARFVRKPPAADVGGYDLYTGTAGVLRDLGFEGPFWVATDEVPEDPSRGRFRAVFRDPDRNVAVWVAPPVDIKTPNEPLIYLSSALEDGRYAVSQVRDPFFAVIDDDMTLAQTIEPMEIGAAVDCHLSFVAESGTRRRTGGTSKRELLHFAGEHQTGIRDRLLAAGSLRSDGVVARPSVSFGIRILKALLTRPKLRNAATGPVPPERLAHLDRLLQSTSRRAPSQRAQWGLMLFSALASLGIGWPLLGLQATVVLVGVIAFHEFGHWLAMKVAGYRNPHITLLPLLGGVTIGHETDPSAAKRAWVSLAGPLPGILLGWALFGYVGTAEAMSDVASDWLYTTAILLLVVNYLNVLPIPPLDGSHVVRALLPARAMMMHVVFVLVAIAVGVYVSVLLDFWILAFIAGLQIFSVRGIWTTGKQIKRYRNTGLPANTDEAGRLLWIYRQDGNAPRAQKTAIDRIGAARSVLNQLDLRPMGWGQGLAVGIVFLGMVAVPVAGVAVAVTDSGRWDEEPAASAYYDEIVTLTAEQQRIADGMSLPALVDDLAAGAGPDAAGAEELEAAAARLGRPLPDTVREFYALHDGHPDIGILPLDEIGFVRDVPEMTEHLGYMVYEGRLLLEYANADDWTEVAPEAVHDWLVIGESDDYPGFLLLASPHATAVPPNSLVSMGDGYATVYADLAELLRERRVAAAMEDIYRETNDRAVELELARLAGAGIEELLETFPQPPLLSRIAMWAIDDAPHVKNDEADLAALESRVGRAVPFDYRYVLLENEKYLPLTLLPASDVVRADTVTPESLDGFLSAALASGVAGDYDDMLDPESLRQCWVIGGYTLGYEPADEPAVVPALLWCPGQAHDRQYVNARRFGVYATFTDVVRAAAAQQNVYY